MEKINNAIAYIRSKTDFKPAVALVLGSGLNDFAKEIQTECVIHYKDIPSFPVSTVAGHDGCFIFGYLENTPVVVMKGRVHYYEGYTMEEVVMPIRVMKLLGANILFLTNAAGGINMTFTPGTLMAINDHITLTIPNPLIGKNKEALGTRFPDMVEVYNKKLISILHKSALEECVLLKDGVYWQYQGPCYETPAEIRLMRILGADAVGMSTVCEAMAANHMKMKICAVSCITNMASGITGKPLSHEEVNEVASRVKGDFTRLVKRSIINIYNSID